VQDLDGCQYENSKSNDRFNCLIILNIKGDESVVFTALLKIHLQSASLITFTVSVHHFLGKMFFI